MATFQRITHPEDRRDMHTVTRGSAADDIEQMSRNQEVSRNLDQAEVNHHIPMIEESMEPSSQPTNPPTRKDLRVYTHNFIPHEQQEPVIFLNEGNLPDYHPQQNLYTTAHSPSMDMSPLPHHMMPQFMHASHAGPSNGYYMESDSVFQAPQSQPAVTPLLNKSARFLRPAFKRAESMLEPRMMGTMENSPLLGHAGPSMSSGSNLHHGMTIIRPESTPVTSNQGSGYHTAYFIQHPSGDANGQYMSYQLADGQQVYMAQSPFVQTGVQVRSLMPDDGHTIGDQQAQSPILHPGMTSQHHLSQPHGGFMMSRSHSDPFSFNMHGMASDTVAMESIVGQNVFCTPLNKQMNPNGFADSPVESMGDGDSTVASTAKKAICSTMSASRPPQSVRSLTPLSAYSTADSSYPAHMSGQYRTALINGEEGVEEELEDEEELARRGMGRASSIARLVHNQGSPTRQPKGRITRPGQLRRANTMMEQSTTVSSAVSARRKVKGTASADAFEEIKTRDAGRTKSVAGAKGKEYVPENVPFGPRSSEKPPWSYAALIGQAILASARKRLALSQIYAWISTAYPYFKPGDAGWMNSIRHNLSLNDCFVKGERGEEDAGGKGSVWMIDPAAEFQFKDGGFKKASKAKAEAAAAAAVGAAAIILDIKKPGQSSGRKRKVTEMEPIPHQLGSHMQQQPFLQPLVIPVQGDAAHHPLSFANMPHQLSNSPALQASPIPPELELAKRLKFDDGETSAVSDSASASASRPTTSQESRHDSSFNASHEMENVPNEHMEHANASFGPDDSSYSLAGVSTPAITERSPEILQSQRKPSFMHRSALDKTTARSQMPTNIADDTFSTPNRPLSVEVQYDQPSSAIFGMLPHLTPSASSPMSSSPAPSTITKVGLMDRRMAQLSELRRPDTVRIRASKDEFSSDPVMSDGVKHATFSIGLAPAAQLNGVTFVEPAIPAKVKRHPDPLDLTKQSERTQVTLSPMHKAHRRVKSVTLPGPSELLSNSPKAADRGGFPNDPLNQLDRLPKSPIGRPKSPSDKFATPVASSQRTRLVNFTPRTLSSITATPMRTSTLGNLIPHQTPAGLMKAQFKAEHGLLDSPMGLSGSCYDMSDASYRVDCELEHLQTRGLQSPTTSYGHQRYQSVVFGYEQSP